MTRVSRLNPTVTPADLPTVNPMDYRAIGKAGVDDTTALNTMFAAAANGAKVQFPKDRTFQYNGTLIVPDGSVTAGGGRDRTNKPNLLAGHANAVIKYGNYCDFRDLLIDGNGVGNWGLQSIYTSVKPGFQNVFAKGFVQAGFVFDGAQNVVLNNCTVKNCKYSYAFYNGVQGAELIGCTSDNSGSVGGAAARVIVVDNSVDARLNGSIFLTGNTFIRVWGGLYEYGAGIHQVDILNGAAEGSIAFIGTQLNGTPALTTNVNVGSGYTGEVVFDNSWFSFGGDPGTAQAVTAAAGRIKYQNVRMTGNQGRNLITKTTLTGTATASYDFESAMLIDSRFQNGLYSHPESGAWGAIGGSVSWNATRKRMVMTCPDTNSGPGTGWLGYQYYAAQYRVIRVRFMILNATGNVRLNTELASGRRSVATALTNGAYDIPIELQGDEVGLQFTSDSGSSVTADVAYVTAEHVA